MDCWAAKSTHATFGNSSTFLGLTKGCIIYLYTQYTLYNYIIIYYIYYILHIHHMDNFKWLAPGSSQEQDSPLYRRMWYGVHSWRHTFRGFGWCCQPFTYWSQVSHIEVFEACTVAFDLAMFQFWKRRTTTHFTTSLSFRFNDSRKVICCLQKGMIRDGMPSPTQTGWKCAVPDSLSATPSKVRDLQNIIMCNQEVLRQKLFLLNRDPNADYTFAVKNMQEKPSALNRRSTSLISN